MIKRPKKHYTISKKQLFKKARSRSREAQESSGSVYNKMIKTPKNHYTSSKNQLSKRAENDVGRPPPP